MVEQREQEWEEKNLMKCAGYHLGQLGLHPTGKHLNNHVEGGKKLSFELSGGSAFYPPTSIPRCLMLFSKTVNFLPLPGCPVHVILG